MEIFLALIALAMLVYLLNRNDSLSNKQDEFIENIKDLEARIKKLELNRTIPEKEENAEDQKVEEKTTIPEIEVPELSFLVSEEVEFSESLSIDADEEEVPSVETPPLSESSNERVKSESFNFEHVPRPIKEKAPVKQKEKSEFWTKVEQQFIENWTGILGSVIMVIGVGFLGIYAALKISALGRFILISGFAAVLGGLFFYLHKKPQWTKLALWLRSSAGAIFLFACTGSVAIPGLKWAETEAMQYLILSLGIAVNLFLGFVGKNEGLASLHVLLSLVAVWVVPASPLSLVIAGVITSFGVALTYREKWDYHLLLTISSFFVFHLLYWFSLKHAVSGMDRIIGIATVLIVGVGVALVHYREAYSKRIFERIPFLVHLVNWLFFGVSLYMYSNGSRVSTFVLTGGSIAAFLLARRAKHLEIRWLFLTDTLIAQVTAIIALITLSRWEVDQAMILSAIFCEGLLFLLVAKKEKDLLLYKIGSVTVNLIGIFLLLYCFILFDLSDHASLYKQAGSLLVSALLGTAFLYHSNKTNSFDLSGLFRAFDIKISEKTPHPVLGAIVGVLFVSYYIHLFEFLWSIYSVLGLISLVLFLRNKLQSVEFAFIALIFLISSHVVNWIELYRIQDQSQWHLLIVGLPLLVASALSVKLSFVQVIFKHLNWIGVYLFSLQLIIVTYYVLAPVSVLAVSVGWLLLALLSIAIVRLIARNSGRYHLVDRYILHVGYFLIGLFLGRFIITDLYLEVLWGPLKARIWVETLAFFVLLLWALTKNKENAEYRSWKYLHPLFAELILLFSFSILTFEIDYRYLGLTWLALAGITFALANWKYDTIGRLALYSFGLFLLSIIQELYIYYQVRINTANNSTFPSPEFLLASVFIVLSLIYLIVFYKHAKLKAFNCPHILRDLTIVGEKLDESSAFIGVYFFGAFLLLITYFMFVSVSEIIPGIIWLLLSPILASFSLYFNGKKSAILNVDRYMLHLTYLFFFSFLIRHVLVHIQIESYVGIFKIRFLIELLALGAFVYCATLKQSDTTRYKSWDYLHPLLIELVILFSIFTIALEVNAIWQPLIWVLISFILAFAGNSKYEKLSRLLFYSLIMYLVAAFQTAFVTSSYVVPSLDLSAQPWVYGTLSLIFQFAFLIYFYLKCNFEKIVLPKPLMFLTELLAKVQESRNIYVFYPLIISTAIFLFWTFDKSLLTLLWVIECLAIFTISIVLKKQHFRYVALGALALCIIRLVFFDLAQSSTLTRAVVFLSVGIIMLLMNSLYNKFKNRFE